LLKDLLTSFLSEKFQTSWTFLKRIPKAGKKETYPDTRDASHTRDEASKPSVHNVGRICLKLS
jgi:hypothetical protein